jgi:FKBP-type peptidyl-prolyl cis-trans isomerase
MRAKWCAAIITGLLAIQASASEKDALKTEKDKLSYAMGVAVAKNLQRQGIDTNPDVLARGIRDAASGGKLLLTDDELRAALDQEKRQRREASAAKKDRKVAGAAFRAENAKKEGVVTLPSGVQYRILKAGDGSIPTERDTVECHYKATLIDGRVFASSYRRHNPAEVTVATTTPGWKEVLKLMPVGSRWQVVVPPELTRAGYARGKKGRALRDETLVYEIELLAIRPAVQDGSITKTAAASGPTP